METGLLLRRSRARSLYVSLRIVALPFFVLAAISLATIAVPIMCESSLDKAGEQGPRLLIGLALVGAFAGAGGLLVLLADIIANRWFLQGDWFMLMEKHLSSGKSFKARQAGNKIIRFTPRSAWDYAANAEAHLQLAHLVQELEKGEEMADTVAYHLTEAVRHYESAIEGGADYSDIHSNKGIAFMGLERYEEAAQSFRRALCLNPIHSAAKKNLAALLKDRRSEETAKGGVGDS